MKVAEIRKMTTEELTKQSTALRDRNRRTAPPAV